MAEARSDVASSGIPGLDTVLAGGFAEGRIFVVKGGPGTGKTTLALQFLLEGIRNREQCLYIGVGGAGDSLCAVADSHGWSLDRRFMNLHEIRASEDVLVAPKRRAFHPAEVDLGERLKGVLNALEQINPRRVVIDTLAELRLLCEDEIEYRRQFLALRSVLARGNRTVLITDYGGESERELHLEAVAHGSIVLEAIAREFGKERRRLRVLKYRGRMVRSGWHDFTIRTGGLQVFPAIIAGEHREHYPDTMLASGNDALDRLTAGGINCGTVTAIIGPSGAGKSSLTLQYINFAAARGVKVAVYIFEETKDSYLARAEGLGLSLQEHVEKGVLRVKQLDVAEISPGEFVHDLMVQVEQGLSMVVIDSLNGYVNSMQEERLLLIQLHELLTYLNQKKVTTFLTVVQHGIVGTQLESSLDISYLMDNVILLRFFEYCGEIRRAISVLKKRRGRHELTIREMKFSADGIHLSEPLHRMQGVLAGMPNLAEENPGA